MLEVARGAEQTTKNDRLFHKKFAVQPMRLVNH